LLVDRAVSDHEGYPTGSWNDTRVESNLVLLAQGTPQRLQAVTKIHGLPQLKLLSSLELGKPVLGVLSDAVVFASSLPNAAATCNQVLLSWPAPRYVGRMKKLTLAVLLLAITACGEDKKSSSDQAAQGNDEPASKSDKDKAEKQPAAEEFDREAFCAEVFDEQSVEAIVGVSFPPLLEYDRSARIASARGSYALCKYSEEANDDVPKHRRKPKWVSAEFDCRERRIDLKEWEEQARRYSPDGEYREVDVGKGGGYSDGLGETHQILFVHSTVPCTIHVTAVRTDDKTEALARHVDGKMTVAIPAWERRSKPKP
jgi:hypothetical protein